LVAVQVESSDETAMIAVAITPFVFALVPVLTSAGRELCFIG